MTTRDKWTRRNVLAGIGAGAALLPFVPLLESDALAGPQAAPPKRLIVWFYPNGTLPAGYFPTTVGDKYEITPILEPLAPHRDNLLILKGIKLKAYDAGVQIVHISCVAPLLTGYTIPTGSQKEGSDAYGWAAGPSVDQVVATAIGGQTPFPSLEFHNIGFKDEYHTQYRVIYKGNQQPLTGMRDPKAAFTRIFSGAPGGGGSTGSEAARLNKSRLNVLDQVTSNLNRLRQRIGVNDRLKLDAHLDAVAALQKRLADVGTDGGVVDGGGPTCTPKPVVFPGGTVPPGDCGAVDSQCAADNYFREYGKAMMDTIVQTLTCDMTRVTSLQWGGGGRGSRFLWLPTKVEVDEHLISHLGNSDPRMVATKDGQYVQIKRFYMEQLAYLIASLKAVPEGAGTLFDNTIILACSEHGVGASHSPDNIPFLIAGGGWHFKTGRYLTFNNASNNDLLLSICQAMGLTLTTFGDPKYSTGPLAGLT